MNFFGLIVSIWTLQACYSHPVSNSGNSSMNEVHLGDYPFHVVLRLAHPNHFLICEGVLIEKDAILTAARCVQKYKGDPESLEVVAGIVSTKNIESESHSQVRQVSSIEISPLWFRSEKKFGDIAILKVSSPFQLNKYAKVAQLGEEVNANEIVQLIGYGDSHNLSKIQLKTISKEDCNLNRNYSPGLFCAKKKGSQMIFGNLSYAGAPLISNNDSTPEILGIAPAQVWGTFTSIDYHKSWIKNIIRVSNSSSSGTTPMTDHEQSLDNGNGSSNVTSTSACPTTEEDVKETSDDSESLKETTSVSTDEPEAFTESDEEVSTTETSIESDESTTDESENSNESTTSTPESEEETSESDEFESEETSTTTSTTTPASPTTTPASSTTTPASSTTTPTSSTTTPASSTTTPASSTTAPASPTTTSASPTTTPASSTTAPASSTTTPASPTTTTASPTTTPASPTTTPASSTTTPASSTTTPASSTIDYYDDYYDDLKSKDNQSHNTKNENDSPIDYSPSVVKNGVTSNSAKASIPSLTSFLISKTSGLFNSIQKLKNLLP